MTILLTTHYLDEADALADRIMVMDDGRIVADDTPDALKARISGDVVAIGLTDAQNLSRAEEAARQAVEIREAHADGSTLHVTVESGATAVAPILRALDAADLPIETVAVSRPSLDDVFLTLTGRSLREDETKVPA